MTWGEFDLWSPHSVRGAAAQQVAAGLLPEPEAHARAVQMFADLLPAGLGTPLHVLRTVRTPADDTVVGHLWMRVRPLSDEVEAFVLDVEICPPHRGRGLGRATLEEAHHLARDLDASVVRLNVFGHDTPASRLYGRLGYTVTSTAMAKRLDRHAPSGGAGGTVHAGRSVRLQDTTPKEYADLRPRLEADHAADLAGSGAVPVTEAARLAADELTRLLPGGQATPGRRLWTAYDGGQPVALVGLDLQERSDGRHAFVHRLWVTGERRGLGLEGAVLRTVEPALRDLGVASAGLMVLGDGSSLPTTYQRFGWTVTARTMARAL